VLVAYIVVEQRTHCFARLLIKRAFDAFFYYAIARVFKKLIGVLSFIKEEISIYNLGITKSKPDMPNIKKSLTGKREKQRKKQQVGRYGNDTAMIIPTVAVDPQTAGTRSSSKADAGSLNNIRQQHQGTYSRTKAGTIETNRSNKITSDHQEQQKLQK
jgi:hypothetical protein